MDDNESGGGMECYGVTVYKDMMTDGEVSGLTDFPFSKLLVSGHP